MEAVTTVKYVIIGSALSGNKGAAAMLESSIQTLSARDSRASFTLLSMYPEEDKRLNMYENLTVLKATPLYLGMVINVLALKWRLFPFLRKFIEKSSPQIKALAEADVLLDQGGITFVDGREKFLIYNVASILPAIMLKTPVIKCAQALGPFHGRINRWAAKYFLPKMRLIVSRGAITHKHLLELGLTNVVEGADYSFSLRVGSDEREAAWRKVDMSFFKDSKVVGVSPSVVMRKKVEAAGKDYVGILVDFINELIDKQGQKVALIPHSARFTSDKTHNNDLPLCRDIYAQINDKEHVLFVDDELSSQELRHVIGQCHLFVASRFHAMVSALAMEVPVLVIGWSHKYQEVLAMFGLEKCAFGLDRLSESYLKRRFTFLEKQRKGITEELSKNLPRVEKLSNQQANQIKSCIYLEKGDGITDD